MFNVRNILRLEWRYIALIFRFSDIYNENMYDTAQVIFIAGNLDIFNNRISDIIKERCRGDIGDLEIPSSLMDEFGIEDDGGSGSTLNLVDIDTYFEMCNTPSVVGKWYCNEDYSTLSKKQKERLEKYIRNPSSNGILVIRVRDFKDSRQLVVNKVIKSSPIVHLIRVSFPNKATLRKLVIDMFREREVGVENKAVDLFILRVNDQYNEYGSLMDRIAIDCKGTEVSYKTMLEHLKGVENFILDDFIVELTKPMLSKNIALNRKIYKIERALLDESTPQDILYKFYKRLDNLIEMRVMINMGAVPAGVRFKVETAQNRIGDGSSLSKLSEFGFMRIYNQAQLTSLKDWVFMKMILGKVFNSDKPSYMVRNDEYYKTLHALINRTTFSSYRLLNDMCIEDANDIYIDKLDKYLYEDWDDMYNKAMLLGETGVDGDSLDIRDRIKSINLPDIDSIIHKESK